MTEVEGLRLTDGIDTHTHIYGQPFGTLAQSPGLKDLADAMRDAPNTSAVAVEATYPTVGTAELLRRCAISETVSGVVGRLQLTDPWFREALERLIDAPGGHLFRGTRQRLRYGDPAWDDTATCAAGVLAEKGLALEILVDTERLHECAAIAESTDAHLVVDHLGSPPLGSDGDDMQGWRNDLAAVAEHPNAACKISGLRTRMPGPYTPESATVVLEHAVDVFGPNRLMIGSDWPVCLQNGSYDESVHSALAVVELLSAAERMWVQRRTAETTYGIHRGGEQV